MKTFIISNWYWFAAVIITAIGAFYAGRQTIDRVASVTYQPGTTLRDTLYMDVLVPYEVKIPVKPLLPFKQVVHKRKDSIVYVPQPYKQEVDTGKIIAGYITENKYSNLLFDNDKGKLVVNTTVQYNRLQNMQYAFTPLEKIISIERKRTLTPFITGTYNTFHYVGIGGGLFINNKGFGIKYLRDLSHQRTGYEGALLIKF